MLFHTHILFSLFIALLLYLWSGRPVSILALLACIFGGVFPDIDEKHSTVGRKFKIISWFAKHRGLFHSLLFALLISGAVYYFLSILKGINFLAIWFFAGYVSHLLLDSSTSQGVAWLAPLTKKKLRGIFRTGLLGEKILAIALIVLIILLSYGLLH